MANYTLICPRLHRDPGSVGVFLRRKEEEAATEEKPQRRATQHEDQEGKQVRRLIRSSGLM